MSLPRLKLPKAPAKPKRDPKPSKAKALRTPTAKQTSADTLAREADILSLLSVLNAAAIADPSLQETLQAIKGALFERDYTTAFSRPDYLRAYCARWVPGRALAYRNLILDSEAIAEKYQSSGSDGFRAVCVGGGAGSEVMALACLVQEAEDPKPLHLTTVDAGDWNAIVEEMTSLLRDRWSLGPDRLAITALHQDVLDAFAGIAFDQADLITLLFTTNELFAASKPKTLALLAHLSATCQAGTLLLVAESVGSYSEMTVAGKTYPLTLVLDQTLAGKGGQWDIVEKDDSRWYRGPEESRSLYKLQLENTHMMVRLYRRQ